MRARVESKKKSCLPPRLQLKFSDSKIACQECLDAGIKIWVIFQVGWEWKGFFKQVQTEETHKKYPLLYLHPRLQLKFSDSKIACQECLSDFASPPALDAGI